MAALQAPQRTLGIINLAAGDTMADTTAKEPSILTADHYRITWNGIIQAPMATAAKATAATLRIYSTSNLNAVLPVILSDEC
jgi:hypothetical protein